MILQPGQKVSDIPSPGSIDTGGIEVSNVTAIDFSGSVQENQTITCPTFASAAQGDYFVIGDVSGNLYAFWLDKDDNGTEPTGAVFVANSHFEIDIATGDTAAQVAAKVKTVLDGVSIGLESVSINSNILTVVFGSVGDVPSPQRHNSNDSGNGSFVVATVTGGALPSLNSKYFTFSGTADDYYFWFDVGGLGVDPALVGKTALSHTFDGFESASEIASAIADEVNNNISSDVTAEASGSKLFLYSVSAGNALNATSGNSGLVIDLVAQGGSVQSQMVSGTGSVESLSNAPSIISPTT